MPSSSSRLRQPPIPTPVPYPTLSRSVADAAVRAVTIDAAGGRAYNTANDYDVTLASYYRLAAEGLGRSLRLVSVPVWVLRLALPVVADRESTRLNSSQLAISYAVFLFTAPPAPDTYPRPLPDALPICRRCRGARRHDRRRGRPRLQHRERL